MRKVTQATVEWSYDALGAGQRRLFDRLSVFAGGFDAPAVDRVCTGAWVDPGDVVPLLGALVDRSLVVGDDEAIPPRFHLLETLRQFGARRLSASGDDGRIKTRHLEWASELAIEARPYYRRPERVFWLDRTEREIDNMREALRFGLEADPAAALRLAGPLGIFWGNSGRSREGRAWCEAALAAAPGAPVNLRAFALASAGMLASHQGDYATSVSLLERAVSARREEGNVVAERYAKHTLAWSLSRIGRHRDARSLIQDTIDAGSPNLADFLGLMGQLVGEAGDSDEAQRLFEQAIAMCAQEENEMGQAHWDMHLGDEMLGRGDLTGAGQHIPQALGRLQELKVGYLLAEAFDCAGRLAFHQGDLEKATTYFQEELHLATDAGFAEHLAKALRGLGALAFRHRDPDQATSLLTRALAVYPNSWNAAACLECLAAGAAAEGGWRQAMEMLGIMENSP